MIFKSSCIFVLTFNLPFYFFCSLTSWNNSERGSNLLATAGDDGLVKVWRLDL